MKNECNFTNMCYLTDATINNAETIFNGESPSIVSLFDLISIVQAAVMNEWLVVSSMALNRSSLLQELEFADTFHVSEKTEDGEKIINITPPKGLEKEKTPVVIDVDDMGQPSANTATGELLLACSWSEMLQEDEFLGSLFVPERVPEGTARGDFYLTKLAGFMLWLQASRNIGCYENEQARQSLNQMAEIHLQRYNLLSQKLIACRDRFGLDFVRSVIEEPLFSLSIAQQVNKPFQYLEKFDKAVHNALIAGRKDALEQWKFPSVGAAVLAKTKRLKDLPKQIQKSRKKLLKPRNKIGALNAELMNYQREMNMGNDEHFQKLNRLKVKLRRALHAFGKETEYKSEIEAFPVSERIWWMPKMLALAVKTMKAPAQALADIAAMPWLRRRSYLRYVSGLGGAAAYAKGARTPIMKHLIKDILRSDWEQANVQSTAVQFATDLAKRCSNHLSPDKIGNKVLIRFKDQDGQKQIVKEDSFWGRLFQNEAMRELFLLGRGIQSSGKN